MDHHSYVYIFKYDIGSRDKMTISEIITKIQIPKVPVLIFLFNKTVLKEIIFMKQVRIGNKDGRKK